MMDINSNYQSHIFTGDDFETNRLKLFLTYPQDMLVTSDCRAVVDLETGSNNVASGDGALSLTLTPDPGAKAPRVVMARKFLDNQDYTGISSVRIWAKVVSKVSTYVTHYLSSLLLLILTARFTRRLLLRFQAVKGL